MRCGGVRIDGKGNKKRILTQNVNKNVPLVGLSDSIVRGAFVVAHCMAIGMHYFQHRIRDVGFTVWHDIVLFFFCWGKWSSISAFVFRASRAGFSIVEVGQNKRLAFGAALTNFGPTNASDDVGDYAVRAKERETERKRRYHIVCWLTLRDQIMAGAGLPDARHSSLMAVPFGTSNLFDGAT